MSTGNDLDLSGTILFEGMANARLKIRNAGFLFIILGILACILSPIIGMSMSVVLGIAFIIGGIFYFFQSFGISGFWGKVVNILFSLLVLGTGGFMVANPIIGGITLIQISMFYLYLSAVLEIIAAFQFYSRDGWWLILINGILSLIFALLLMNNPDVAGWVLGLVLGISLIIKGISLLSLSYTK